jgi:hypothetical protein
MSSIWLVYGSRRRTGSNPGRWPCEGLSVFVLVGILDTRVALTPRTSGNRWRDFGRLTLLVFLTNLMIPDWLAPIGDFPFNGVALTTAEPVSGAHGNLDIWLNVLHINRQRWV